MKRLETVDRPLKMLGEKANAWTLEHAFTDVQTLADLEGKVVVLDFWATWCPWCIKSFPAIRDLLKDYADKDLQRGRCDSARSATGQASSFQLEGQYRNNASMLAAHAAAALKDTA